MHLFVVGLQLSLSWIHLVLSEVSEVKIKDSPPFLGNYLIEDTCQFQLCGPTYNLEWNVESPEAGSCSGDCSLLAITLNSNKFHKEFLWSSCANMCGDKYPADRNPEYKSRFLCMESCYSAYNLVSPHHNIARYCMQAACKGSHLSMHKVDCFEKCASHVSSSLPESSWRVWAKAIASTCSTSNFTSASLESRLECGDGAVWEHISTVQEKAEAEHSALCLHKLCDNEVKCGVSCLKHIHALHQKQRSEWVSCSLSSECTRSPDWHGRQSCADNCLLQLEAERERLTRLRTESQTQVQLQYSSSAAGTPVNLIQIFTCIYFLASV